MNIPLLSVVIPCYNQGHYILELIACFPNYHDQNTYEIIIVNDGSTDKNTLSILEQFASQGFIVLHQQNQGVCLARNNGITAAKGQYILPVDGDDKVSPQFIFDAIEIFQNNPEYSVVYSDGEYFGNKTGVWNVGEFNLQRIMLWNYLHISSVFRKSAWAAVNGYDPNANGLEDWDFWLSIAFNGGKFFYLKKNHFQYRILPNSANRSLTDTRYRELQDYLEKKHAHFLNKECLGNHFASKFKGNKKLWLKLVLKVYFPKYLKKLVEKGKLTSMNLD